MRYVSPTSMVAMWLRADALGQPRTSLISRQADFAAGCQSPFFVTFFSAEDSVLALLRSTYATHHLTFREWRRSGFQSRYAVRDYQHVRVYLDAWLPCRRCSVCLRKRATMWRRRIQSELSLSSRTWFATFTVNPENRLRYDILRDVGRPLTDDQIFADRHRLIQRDFTLFFKRVRKVSRAPLRYCLVAEAHRDGWPHYHALIHERGPQVTKRQLEAAWRVGYTSFKLVDSPNSRTAFYVTKYVAKQALARIRASLRYGSGLLAIEQPVALLRPAERDNLDTLTRAQEFRLAKSELALGYSGPPLE